MEEKYYWEENINIKQFPKLKEDIEVDVLIIGGGITGILCAHELAKRKVNYALVEQHKIGKNTSKKTTAFITAQHEKLYQDIIKEKGKEVAKKYLDINLKAIDKYKELSKIYDFDFKECTSALYSSKSKDIILKEKEALDSLDYNVELISTLPLNFPIELGIKFSNQASLHPLKLISELSKNLIIYENTKIKVISDNHAYTSKNKIKFKNVIITTHYPFINFSGFYYAKLTQRRSYVCALKHETFEGTFSSIDDDGVYFRAHNNYLIIGGNDRDNKEKVSSIFKDKVQKIFEQKIDYSWSGQDCITLDGIPYIGRYDRFHKNYYVATGFNLWGFTWAMASSFILLDIMDNKNKYDFLSPQRHLNKKELISNISNSIKNLVTLKTPRCKHLGCALTWNELENTWECPCHGSRYDSNGKVIDGPAKKNIKIKEN